LLLCKAAIVYLPFEKIVQIPQANSMTMIEEEAEDLEFLLELLEEEKIEKEKERENNEIGRGSCSSGSESESKNDEIGRGSCSFGSESESKNDEIGRAFCSSGSEKESKNNEIGCGSCFSGHDCNTYASCHDDDDNDANNTSENVELLIDS
jgi:hypothetical protein